MPPSDRSLLPSGSMKHGAPATNPSSRSTRTIVLVASAAAVILIVGIGVSRWAGRDDTSDRPAKAVTTVATTTVTRGDISTRSSMSGTVGYGPTRKVSTSQGG